MADLSEARDELNFLSSQLSTLVRTVALGMLALSWGLLVGETPVNLTIDPSLREGLVRVGLLALFVLVLDFLHYLVGYTYVLGVYRAAEKQGIQVKYSRKAFGYRLRLFLFWAKTIAVTGTALYLFLIAGMRFF